MAALTIEEGLTLDGRTMVYVPYCSKEEDEACYKPWPLYMMQDYGNSSSKYKLLELGLVFMSKEEAITKSDEMRKAFYPEVVPTNQYSSMCPDPVPEAVLITDILKASAVLRLMANSLEQGDLTGKDWVITSKEDGSTIQPKGYPFVVKDLLYWSRRIPMKSGYVADVDAYKQFSKAELGLTPEMLDKLPKGVHLYVADPCIEEGYDELCEDHSFYPSDHIAVNRLAYTDPEKARLRSKAMLGV